MNINELRAMGYSESEIDDIRNSGPELKRIRKLKASIRNAQETIRDMEDGYQII